MIVKWYVKDQKTILNLGKCQEKYFLSQSIGYRSHPNEDNLRVIARDKNGETVSLYPNTREHNEKLDWLNIHISSKDEEALKIVRRTCDEYSDKYNNLTNIFIHYK